MNALLHLFSIILVVTVVNYGSWERVASYFVWWLRLLSGWAIGMLFCHVVCWECTGSITAEVGTAKSLKIAVHGVRSFALHDLVNTSSRKQNPFVKHATLVGEKR